MNTKSYILDIRMNAVLIRDFQNKIHARSNGYTHACGERLQSYNAQNSLQTQNAHTVRGADRGERKKKYTRGKKYQSRFTFVYGRREFAYNFVCVCVCCIPLYPTILEHEQCVCGAVRHDMGHAASDTHFNCVAQYLFFGSLIY